MDVVKENIKLVSVREEEAEGYMETDDFLRRRRRVQLKEK